MTQMIRAPFTSEQVTVLNLFQERGDMHPFTCGSDRHDQSPPLDATHSGWICPDPACEYTQDWAHAFMADPEAWPAPIRSVSPAPHDDAVISIPLSALDGLITVARWVSRGQSYAHTPDPAIADTYPDAAARQALGALDDAGLLNPPKRTQP
ncbi:hypothetical protein ACIQPQ_31435 [Streptomyces sp. NPDC091281]|uniref:hypothetical protein n=1 Tax=Streptomyces sp. NPDC091281 TaxID=3365985 RepID=UPI00383084B7